MIQEAISKLVEKQNLTQQEAKQVMNEVMEGKATDAQISAFLISLRMKGETIEEIIGCAKKMKEKANRINPKVKYLVDTCGTGGDKSNTFNISTAAAFVVAGSGVAVAKHGNKSVSSKCGSADVLSALGVNIQLQPEEVKKCIEEIGIGFMFAPLFHPAMKYVMNARKEVGVRTVFNILGPLTNPANAKCQVIGVFSPELLETMASVLKNLGSKHVMVVNGNVGENKLDEISISGKTKICELKNNIINTYDLNPEDFGFKLSPLTDILGGNAEENAKIIIDILKGKKGPKRDIVLLNAGAAIYVSDKVTNIKEGIEIARQSIDSGNAMKKLEELKRYGKL